MPIIKTKSDLGNIKTLEDIVRFVAIFAKDIVDNINGRLEFDTNLKSDTVEVTFSTANAEKEISHGLGKVPTGYLVKRASAACSIYDGDTKNSATKIYLKSSAAATVRIIVV